MPEVKVDTTVQWSKIEVTLKLSAIEAAALLIVTRNIGGAPADSIRGITQNIGDAIERASPILNSLPIWNTDIGPLEPDSSSLRFTEGSMDRLVAVLNRCQIK